jgi:hypothetical protein
MINMEINFHFNNINMKDEHFHVDLNRFYKIAYTCRKCSILQNGLQIDELLLLLLFSKFENLKKYLCIVKLCML